MLLKAPCPDPSSLRSFYKPFLFLFLSALALKGNCGDLKGDALLEKANQAYRNSNIKKAIKLTEKAQKRFDPKENEKSYLRAHFRQLHFIIKLEDDFSGFDSTWQNFYKRSKANKKEYPLFYARALYYKAWLAIKTSFTKQAYQNALTRLKKAEDFLTQKVPKAKKDLGKVWVLKSYVILKIEGKYQGGQDKALQLVENDQIKDNEARAFIYYRQATKLKNRGKKQKAIATLRKGIAQWENFSNNHHLTGFKFYLDLTKLFTDLTKLKSAENFADRAYHLLKVNDKLQARREAALHIKLGKLERLKNRTYNAKNHFKEAIFILEAHYTKEEALLSEAQEKLATIHIMLKEHDKSVRLCKKNIKYLKRFSKNTNALLSQIGNQWYLMGNAYMLNESAKQAEEAFKKALSLTKKINSGPFNKARINNNLSVLKQRQGDYEAAKAYTKKASHFYLKLFPPNSLKIAHFVKASLANVYLKEGKYDSALSRYQEGLKINAVDFEEDAYQAYPSPLAIRNAEYAHIHAFKKGIAFAKRYEDTKNLKDLKRSLKAFHYSDKYLQKIRRNNIIGRNNLSILKYANKLYANAVDVSNTLLRNGEDENINREKVIRKAYQYLDKKKGFILEGQQSKTNFKDENILPDSLIKAYRGVNKKVKTLNDSAKKVNDHHVESAIQGKRVQLLKRKKEIFNTIKQTHPDYYKKKFSQEVANLIQLHKRLGDKNANLIEYLSHNDSLYSMVITPNKAKIVTLSNEGFPLKEKVIAFRKALIKEKDFDKTLANKFYRIFFKPLEPFLTTDKLIIVPDGVMSYLPFELMLQKKPEKTAQGDNPYLIKDYVLSYSPSSTLWLSQIAEKEKDVTSGENRIAFTGFAPDFSSGNTQVADLRGIKNSQRYSLGAIPGAKTELQLSAKFWNAQTYFNNKATEARFKKEAPGSRIIHLASHGVINPNNPAYSKLMFASDSASKEDGELHNYEIYDLNLNADLAVLSACRTGYRDVKTGAGVMSLARGFRLAGCKNILMTLWPVEDQSSAKLVQGFYQNLKEGMAKQKALREAKLSYIESHSNIGANPFYWAGYVLMGSDVPVPKPNQNTSYYMWLILPLGFLVLLIPSVIWIKRRKRQNM